MGGEKHHSPQAVAPFPGSPPRGRGKGATPSSGQKAHRITPAWAGKRDGAAPTGGPPRDHPRVGGEKPKEQRGDIVQQGSPPRGRGKVYICILALKRHGITPAWAGKSYIFGPLRPGSWDHPRVGGEKVPGPLSGHRPPGSPPRGRGKALILALACASSGITPAWAGKRLALCYTSISIEDHPRVGGEKTKKIP